jgi:hypothetical protein
MWLRVPDGVDDVTAAAAYDGLLRQVAAGDIRLDGCLNPSPLGGV